MAPHSEPEPDWYLQEWAQTLGKRQADLARDLGLLKNSAFKIWHGKQPYSRQWVNRIATWLGIAPYELLLPPREAMALRRLRDTMQAIIAEDGATFAHDHPTETKQGRDRQ